MSDLTLPQRLRQRAIRHSDILAREAADELDRLNAQALELCAEISKLTRERQEWRSRMGLKVTDDVVRENERLRGEVIAANVAIEAMAVALGKQRTAVQPDDAIDWPGPLGLCPDGTPHVLHWDAQYSGNSQCAKCFNEVRPTVPTDGAT